MTELNAESIQPTPATTLAKPTGYSLRARMILEAKIGGITPAMLILRGDGLIAENNFLPCCFSHSELEYVFAHAQHIPQNSTAATSAARRMRDRIQLGSFYLVKNLPRCLWKSRHDARKNNERYPISIPRSISAL